MTKEEFIDSVIDKIYLHGTKEDGKYTLTLTQARNVSTELFNDLISNPEYILDKTPVKI